MSANVILPAKPDIERLVLGSILMRGDRFATVRGAIDGGVFTSSKHKALWDAMTALHERGVGIDRITILHALSDMAPGVWGLGELAELDDDLPEIPALDGYLDLLIDVAERRKALMLLETLSRAISDGSESRAAIATASRIGLELAGAGEKPELLDVAGIVAAAGGLDSVMAPHVNAPAIPWPWESLCRVSAGLTPGQLTVVAGRPGDGKSTFAFQVAHHAAVLGSPVAIFSLEMSGLDILRRLACILAGVPLGKFIRGYGSRDEMATIARKLGELATVPLSIDESHATSVPAIRRAIMRAKRKPAVVVVDYLQLMSSPNGGRQRHEELGLITRGLKILSREVGVSVLGLSQVTRNNEHEKREPQLRDLRESGSIEQDADAVFMLHHLGSGEERGHDHATKVLVRKQRLGPIGEVTVSWNARLASFADAGEWGQS